MSVAEASPIGDVLAHVRMSGIFYCPSILTEPWGLEIPPMEHCVWFHVVSSGAASVQVGDAPPLTAVPGDLVLVPHGTGHRAYGVEPAPTRPVLELPHEEIARILGSSVGAVKANFFHALGNLRRLLDKEPTR